MAFRRTYPPCRESIELKTSTGLVCAIIYSSSDTAVSNSLTGIPAVFGADVRDQEAVVLLPFPFAVLGDEQCFATYPVPEVDASNLCRLLGCCLQYRRKFEKTNNTTSKTKN